MARIIKKRTRDPYQEFIASKSQLEGMHGFEPIFMPNCLKDFQSFSCDWAIRKGRSAIFQDCGLGKTLQELVWCENVHRKTNKPVILLCPLAVAHQTVKEAAKFGIEAKLSRDGNHGNGIVVTNYQQLHKFDKSKFGGIACDESSILKNFKGATKHEITEFARMIEFRLLATATASPNDYEELGTSSEALGYLGYNDMLDMFFKQIQSGQNQGWARSQKYRFRGHSAEKFWQWVSSWARAARKPSDLGFSDIGYDLPPLIENEVVLDISNAPPGYLFNKGAKSMKEQRNERKSTMRERCEEAARLAVAHDGASVIWCNLNPEGQLLAKIVPDAVEVSGSMKDEVKEERLLAFANGEIKRLITKPKIGCFGLNWQHCHNVIAFPTDSFEQYYQLVRRCWRFGQVNPVTVSLVTTEASRGTLNNLKRKSNQMSVMFESLVRHMNEAIEVDRGFKFNNQGVIPSWLPSLTNV